MQQGRPGEAVQVWRLDAFGLSSDQTDIDNSNAASVPAGAAPGSERTRMMESRMSDIVRGLSSRICVCAPSPSRPARSKACTAQDEHPLTQADESRLMGEHSIWCCEVRVAARFEVASGSTVSQTGGTGRGGGGRVWGPPA